ncbi:MAG TPA: 3-dehydroquinate synthase [Gemmatimonadales bacterium]
MGLLAHLPDIAARHVSGRRLVIIADDQVARALTIPLDVPVLTFPAGEASKTRETWAHLTDQLLQRGFGRDTALVALGGGVTGDLAGFVAATFLRGVPFLQVPTTLLAMLDASVGGKTGVDTPAGKNLVGAFHQPAAVVMDPAVLATVPEADLRAGLAEAVKHAAILDAVHFGWLGGAAGPLLARDLGAIEMLIRRSVAIKVEIVQRDETEKGRRAVLNAGHSVAHALEVATGYRISHGEAVAIGLVVEASLGEELGVTEPGTAAVLAALLQQFHLPTGIPADTSPDALLDAMRADKKNRSGAIRLALLARIGTPAGDETKGWTTAVGEEEIRLAIQKHQVLGTAY